MESWYSDVKLLKKEMIKFLLRKREYKLIFVNLFLHGILIRVSKNYGKLKRIFDKKVLCKNFTPFYKVQKKEYSFYKY